MTEAVPDEMQAATPEPEKKKRGRPKAEIPARIKVDVDEADITRAFRSDSANCVVATALARTVPDAVRIMVDTQLIRYTSATTGERLGFLTPYQVQQYVVAFDAGDKVTPFSFTLRNPVPMRQNRSTPKRTALTRIARKKKQGKQPSEADIFIASQPGPTQIEATDKAIPRAAPRVFRTKMRSYGHRVLRINQARGVENARIEPFKAEEETS